jgi:hypothetical protein
MSNVVTAWEIQVKTKFDRSWRALRAGSDQHVKRYADRRRAEQFVAAVNASGGNVRAVEVVVPPGEKVLP